MGSLAVVIGADLEEDRQLLYGLEIMLQESLLIQVKRKVVPLIPPGIALKATEDRDTIDLHLFYQDSPAFILLVLHIDPKKGEGYRQPGTGWFK